MHPALAWQDVDWEEYIKSLKEDKMSEEHIERTKRMIEVMQAYVDGDSIMENLYREVKYPSWDWEKNSYIVSFRPDIINWDHISSDFKYMARDENGDCFIYWNKPKLGEDVWYVHGICVKAERFASYQKGTVNWKDSLVIRPGCE